MTRLFLVRHGETTWNQLQKFQGHTDVPLSARGWWQAKRLAERFARESITAIYASDLARARDTAQVIARAVRKPVVCEPRLREAYLGELQGLDYAVVRDRWFRANDALPCYFVETAPPGIECLRQLQSRVMRAVCDIAARNRDQTILVVMHGACLRAVMCAWLGTELAAHAKLNFDPASVSEVELHSRNAVVALLNDTAHLHSM
ncbi:MAG: histidine phosphatase family protein [Chloroflexi bacterium]|nr:histidine phosphatase family protein [Chloroflexota bacterium]